MKDLTGTLVSVFVIYMLFVTVGWIFAIIGFLIISPLYLWLLFGPTLGDWIKIVRLKSMNLADKTAASSIAEIYEEVRRQNASGALLLSMSDASYKTDYRYSDGEICLESTGLYGNRDRKKEDLIEDKSDAGQFAPFEKVGGVAPLSEKRGNAWTCAIRGSVTKKAVNKRRKPREPLMCYFFVFEDGAVFLYKKDWFTGLSFDLDKRFEIAADGFFNNGKDAVAAVAKIIRKDAAKKRWWQQIV